MELKYTVNPHIPVTHQRHLVYVLIEVEPGEEQETAASLNLSLVVDASRSMAIPILTERQFRDLADRGMAKQAEVDGVSVWQFEVPRGFKLDAPSNIEFTKQALHIVADQLRPGDHYSLVSFAEKTQLMVPYSPGDQSDALVQAIDQLDKVELGDETYMARGMEMGHAQALPGVAPNVISRIIVLTDGYTKEERDCYAWTRRAKGDGIVVSTMGLGLDFNEELLISLADVSGGHAYFIQDPAEIPKAFREELAAAQSISWRDLALSLALPTDVTLRRAHRVSPTIAQVAANPNAIDLGDLEASQPPSVLLELVVPPRPAATYRLCQAALHARPASGGTKQIIDQHDIVVHYTERPSQAEQTDPHLMSVIQRVSAFKLQNQAMKEANRGNVAGATRRLRRAGERLIELGKEDLGQTMLTEAERMEKEGQMSAEGTKKMRYGTRKLG